jgi:hypothetical protein
MYREEQKEMELIHGILLLLICNIKTLFIYRLND